MTFPRHFHQTRQRRHPRKGLFNSQRSVSLSTCCLKSSPTLVKALAGLVAMQLIALCFISVIPLPFRPVTSSSSLDLLDSGQSKKELQFARSLISDNHRRRTNETTITQPLDDYTTRKHMSMAIGEDMPILVVGGSDGSGTRAFVEVLGRLGVPMLIDDTGTADVHASCMFDGDGWPALVRSVLKTTRSANYSWEDFPLAQRSMLQSTMDRFKVVYGKRAANLREHGIKDGFRLAEKVRYGFKAPVSMLLLPILRQAYRRIKFLHVIRDGRDVSLSNNKSPVQKFYHVFYSDGSKNKSDFENITEDILLERMAMQLWNDWNIQTLDWESKHSDGKTFDYLIMRTEDLMNPTTRLTSLRQLADFVGSQRNDTELCCLSKQKIKDMGKSGVRRPPKLHMRRQPTLWDKLAWSLARLWYKTTRLLGMARHSFGDNRFVSRSHGVGTGRGEAEPRSSYLSADRPWEPQRFKNGLREQNPGLFKKIKRGRQRRQSPIHGFDSETSTNSGVARRLAAEDSFHFHTSISGNAVRVPWRKESTIHHIAVDHAKYDTMLERIKEAEGGQHRLKESPLLLNDDSRHHSEQPESQEQVMERYGKWIKAVEGRPDLEKVLHKEGAIGLGLFGYEPRAQYSDFPAAGVCLAPPNCHNA